MFAHNDKNNDNNAGSSTTRPGESRSCVQKSCHKLCTQ